MTDPKQQAAMSEARLQYIILFHHFREMLKQARKREIDVMPLKGAHLLTRVYPENEDRGMMADIDFLVRAADWERALRLLSDCGFTPRDHFSDETKRHEQGFCFSLANDKSFLFEIHRHLMAPERYTIDTEGIWKRAYSSKFDGVHCLRMADEDVFCHVAWHNAIHRFMNHGRTLRDLELILLFSRQKGQMQTLTTKIAERALEWHVTRAVWLYFVLLAKRNPELERADASALIRAMDMIAPPRHIQQALLALIGPEDRTRFSMCHHRTQAAIIWPIVFDHKRHLLKMLFNHPRIVGLRPNR